MSETNRAAVESLLALHPDDQLMTLRELLVRPLITGGIDRGVARAAIVDHLLDPGGGPIPGAAGWADTSTLFEGFGPDHALLAHAEAAAVFALDGEDPAAALAAAEPRRFAPRADALIAIAVAELPRADAAAALARLHGQPGPDEPVLRLSLLQAGRGLVFHPELIDQPIGRELIAQLLALIVPTTPPTLLDDVGRILGPIAAGPAGATVLAACRDKLTGAMPRRAGSFLDEVNAIDRGDGYIARTGREQLARAVTRILGRAAPEDPAGFEELRHLVIDDRPTAGLLPAFLEGLVAGARVAPLAGLFHALLDDVPPDPLSALAIAAQVPLDIAAEDLAGAATVADPAMRRLAVQGASLLAPDLAVSILAPRLEDAAPLVAALAARRLIDLAQRPLVEEVAASFPPGLHGAVLRAALGVGTVEVVGELTVAAAIALDAEGDDEAGDDWAELLRWAVLASAEGLEAAAEVIGSGPAGLAAIALALTGGEHLDVPLVVPAGPRDRLRAALLSADRDAEELALAAAARIAPGDSELAAHVCRRAAAGAISPIGAAAALGSLRVRDDRTAGLLAPLLGSDEIALQLAATAAAGTALAPGHPGWRHVRGLLELGSSAASVAHRALVAAARRDQGYGRS